MDHYKTLGLRREASKDEIKAAFRRCAFEFHPDRHSQSPPPIRDWALRRFKQASEAYEVLVDDSRRAAYDHGRCTRSRSGYHGPRGERDARWAARAGGGGRRVEWEVFFNYLTSRRFVHHAILASCLLGGTAVIEKAGEAIWKMNNYGKSFEETMRSLEKTKEQKSNR